MKQRVRKLIEYTWADKLHYAVAGTPNLLEYDQGFFVKGGDGLADVKPIAGLYKQQVFTLARYLELPAGISERMPTTETFSLPQSQEEFYFGYPYEQMDMLVWGQRNGIAAHDVAHRTGLDAETVGMAYREIGHRRSATAYLSRRDAADPHGARAAVPARAGYTRARDHGDRDRRGRRRAVLGL